MKHRFYGYVVVLSVFFIHLDARISSLSQAIEIVQELKRAAVDAPSYEFQEYVNVVRDELKLFMQENPSLTEQVRALVQQQLIELDALMPSHTKAPRDGAPHIQTEINLNPKYTDPRILALRDLLLTHELAFTGNITASEPALHVQAPTTIETPFTLILPDTTGLPTQVLTTDGNTPAHLYWSTVSATATVVTGTSCDTPLTLVLRDSTGSFAATTITLTGNSLINYAQDYTCGDIGSGYIWAPTNQNTIIGWDGAGNGNLLTGTNNVVLGYAAAAQLNSGFDNTVIGAQAGSNIVDGTNNIYLGAFTTGASDESGTIRIGTQGTQTSAYMAGVYDVMPPEPYALMLVTNNGQLGASASFLNTLTTATSCDTPLTLVLRDSTGSFAATTITLTGNSLINYSGVGGCDTGSGYIWAPTNQNTIIGWDGAGNSNTLTGTNNVVLGYAAAAQLNSGFDNTVVGAQAGSNIVDGTNNIYLGAFTTGASDESGTIRIGTQGTQTSAYMAGVYDVMPPEPYALMLVNNNGQLGASASFLNTLTTATSCDTPLTLVLRDSTGSFAATTITLTGNSLINYSGVGGCDTGSGYIWAPTNQNTIIGWDGAGNSNTLTGTNNVVLGYAAAAQLNSGFDNTVVGAQAGSNIVDGTNNIYLGAFTTGASDESGTIRIGTQGTQTSAYMAGVYDVMPPEPYALMLVNNNGQLGASASFLNTLTTATSCDTPLTLVLRDSTGSFAATTITLTGNSLINYSGVGGCDTGSGYIWAPTNQNTIIGWDGAGNSNLLTGTNNVVLGYAAAAQLNSGFDNTVVGAQAGSNIVDGTNNIYLGAFTTGASDESGTIRIGTQGTQTSAYMAGVYDVMPPEPYALMLVNNNGQLGASASFLNTLTTATGCDTPLTLVLRDSTGSFAATTITLTGNSLINYSGVGGCDTGSGYIWAPTNQNTIIGWDGAGNSNTLTGTNNVVLGYAAAAQLSSGFDNTVVGAQAGSNIVDGTNNIYLGAFTTGASDESGTIRIGTQGTQTSAYMAGIYGVTPTPGPLSSVVINSAGQLGVGSVAPVETGTSCNSFLELVLRDSTGSFAATTITLTGNSLINYAQDYTCGDIGSGYIWAPTNQNTIIGWDGAGNSNTLTGTNNVVLGYAAAAQLNSGFDNTVIGANAGDNLQTGTNNIYLGVNVGTGASDESGTIRIGTQGTQTSAYMAGIYDRLLVTGFPVVVNTQGQLGIGSTLPTGTGTSCDVAFALVLRDTTGSFAATTITLTGNSLINYSGVGGCDTGSGYIWAPNYYNTIIGLNAGSANNGSYNIYLGSDVKGGGGQGMYDVLIGGQANSLAEATTDIDTPGASPVGYNTMLDGSNNSILINNLSTGTVNICGWNTITSGSSNSILISTTASPSANLLAGFNTIGGGYYNTINTFLPAGMNFIPNNILSTPNLATGFIAPFGIAITPNGTYAYVVNSGNGTVSIIDIATNQPVGSPIPVGVGPRFIAITPDGQYAYITNYGSTGTGTTVSVIDIASQREVSTITVGTGPIGIAITPDGQYAYVTNYGSTGTGATVSVIDIASQREVSTITVGTGPGGIAITPDGQYAYVTNYGPTGGGDTVRVIDIANQGVVSTITVGTGPTGIAITPNGQYAYVVNNGSGTVSIIDIATNQPVGSSIAVGTGPDSIAITPDGQYAYVTNNGSSGGGDTVSVIDIATNQTVGSPITVGTGPHGIAITPNGQYAYVADFSSDAVSAIALQAPPMGLNSIGGGSQNQITVAPYSAGYGSNVICGGISNIITNTNNPGFIPAGSFIGTGYYNTILGNPSAIVSGNYNTIGTNTNGQLSSLGFIGGGQYNTIVGIGNAIVGGAGNSITGAYSVIPGGAGNLVTGTGSFAAGMNAQAVHDNAFVWSDGQNGAFSSHGPNTFNVNAAAVYMNGIYGVTPTPGPLSSVVINSAGQLGVGSVAPVATGTSCNSFLELVLRDSTGSFAATTITLTGNSLINYAQDYTCGDIGSGYIWAPTNQNTIIGWDGAGNSNTLTGTNNVVLGYAAAAQLGSGFDNTVIGANAGDNLQTGTNNIYLGVNAGSGASDESGTIRIGTQGTQTSAYMAGIYDRLLVTGFPVVVNTQGQLGIGSTLPTGTGTSCDVAFALVLRDTTGSFAATTITLTGNSLINYIQDYACGEVGSGYIWAPTNQNTIIGWDGAGKSNTLTGTNNVVLGYAAASQLNSGFDNTVVGAQAGSNIVDGTNNIYLGAFTTGASDESGTIRIGTQGTQTSAYMAGIYGVTPTPGPLSSVVINSAGQLGVGSVAPVATGTSCNSFLELVLRDSTGSFAATTITLTGNSLINYAQDYTCGDIGTGYIWAPNNQNSLIGVGINNNNIFSGLNLTGTSNIALGYNALVSSTAVLGLIDQVLPNLGGTLSEKFNNIAIGPFALEQITGVYSAFIPAPFNNLGSNNIAVGTNALQSSLVSSANIAIGTNALMGGQFNLSSIAIGHYALSSTGTAVGSNANIAIGIAALQNNQTGSHNVAIGSTDTDGNRAALQANILGNYNVAVGFDSLASNTSGSYNVGVGIQTLATLSSGSYNTAIGVGAGDNIQTGTYNIYLGAFAAGASDEWGTIRIGTQGTQTSAYMAGIYGVTPTPGPLSTVVINGAGQLGIGSVAPVATGTSCNSFLELVLRDSTGSFAATTITLTGNSLINYAQDYTCGDIGSGYIWAPTNQNTIIGWNGAGNSNTLTGTDNVVLGYAALANIESGFANTVLGTQAGANIITGTNNIYLGTLVTGTYDESGTIRIGTENVQQNCYIAGIWNVPLSNASTVNIDQTGHLGTTVSSARYKKNIADLGDATSDIYRLRPVSFNYLNHEHTEYGLIAEEVEKIYPDIVIKNRNGQPETVQYQHLPIMMLNEMQKDHATLLELQQKIRILEEKISTLTH